jgi:hypothetical protein
MHTTVRIALLGCAALVASPVWAGIMSVDFGHPDAGFVQGVSTTATYTLPDGEKILAYGYNGSPSAPNAGTLISLFAKTAGGDEEGLGLTNDPTHDDEITVGNYIQLDLSGLKAISFTVKIGSSTGSDAYALYDSSMKGIAGTVFASGTTEKTFTFTAAEIAADPFISLTATSGNVLVGPGTVTPVPEPGTLLSMGAGFIAIGLGLRKKLSK